MYDRRLRVNPYPRVYPYPTRTRGPGMGRVGVSRVGSGTSKVITGTGVPGFTRTDVQFWGHIIAAKRSIESYYRLIQPGRHNVNLQWHTLECAKKKFPNAYYMHTSVRKLVNQLILSYQSRKQ